MKIPRFLSVLVLLSGMALAFAPAMAADDGTAFPSCAHCGMDRVKFARSRMRVEYEDGTAVGTCSLRCVVMELDGHPDKRVKSIRVADYDTRNLLDAKKAVWVIGGSRKGVMTRRAKWAFASEAAAKKFIAAYGGASATFDAALRAAREDLQGGMGRGHGMRKGSMRRGPAAPMADGPA